MGIKYLKLLCGFVILFFGTVFLHFSALSSEAENLTSDTIVIPSTGPDILIGDIDGNGIVNSTDFMILKKYIIGVIDEFPSQFCMMAADVNSDTDINSTDYAMMKRYLLGYIDKFATEL